MDITKEMLDMKVSDFEKTDADWTYREFIMLAEDEFEMEHADLDSMSDEELNDYDSFLFELSLK